MPSSSSASSKSHRKRSGDRGSVAQPGTLRTNAAELLVSSESPNARMWTEGRRRNTPVDPLAIFTRLYGPAFGVAATASMQVPQYKKEFTEPSAELFELRVPSMSPNLEMIDRAFTSAYADACYRSVSGQDTLLAFGPNCAFQLLMDQRQPNKFQESQAVIEEIVTRYYHDLLATVTEVIDAEDQHVRFRGGPQDGIAAGSGGEGGGLNCRALQKTWLHYSMPVLGRIVVKDGFFFCFWNSSLGEKIGELECRACRWVAESHIAHLHVPLYYHFRYKGRGVTVASLIPIGENLTKVTDQNPEVAAMAQMLASAFCLTPYGTSSQEGEGGGEKSKEGSSYHFLPKSVQAHYARDGRYYFVRNRYWFPSWLCSHSGGDSAAQHLSRLNPRLLTSRGTHISCRAFHQDAYMFENKEAIELMRNEIDDGLRSLLGEERESIVNKKLRMTQKKALKELRRRRIRLDHADADTAAEVPMVGGPDAAFDGSYLAAGDLGSPLHPQSQSHRRRSTSHRVGSMSNYLSSPTTDGTGGGPMFGGGGGGGANDDFADSFMYSEQNTLTAARSARDGSGDDSESSSSEESSEEDDDDTLFGGRGGGAGGPGSHSIMKRYNQIGYSKSLLGAFYMTLTRFPAPPFEMLREVKREILFRGLKAFIQSRSYEARFGVEQLLAELPTAQSASGADGAGGSWGDADVVVGDVLRMRGDTDDGGGSGRGGTSREGGDDDSPSDYVGKDGSADDLSGGGGSSGHVGSSSSGSGKGAASSSASGRRGIFARAFSYLRSFGGASASSSSSQGKDASEDTGSNGSGASEARQRAANAHLGSAHGSVGGSSPRQNPLKAPPSLNGSLNEAEAAMDTSFLEALHGSVFDQQWTDFVSIFERVVLGFMQYDGSRYPQYPYYRAATVAARNSEEAAWAESAQLTVLFTEQVLPFTYRKFRIQPRHADLYAPLEYEDKLIVYNRLCAAFGVVMRNGQIAQCTATVKDFLPAVEVVHRSDGDAAKSDNISSPLTLSTSSRTSGPQPSGAASSALEGDGAATATATATGGSRSPEAANGSRRGATHAATGAAAVNPLWAEERGVQLVCQYVTPLWIRQRTDWLVRNLVLNRKATHRDWDWYGAALIPFISLQRYRCSLPREVKRGGGRLGPGAGDSRNHNTTNNNNNISVSRGAGGGAGASRGDAPMLYFSRAAAAPNEPAGGSGVEEQEMKGKHGKRRRRDFPPLNRIGPLLIQQVSLMSSAPTLLWHALAADCYYFRDEGEDASGPQRRGIGGATLGATTMLLSGSTAAPQDFKSASRFNGGTTWRGGGSSSGVAHSERGTGGLELATDLRRQHLRTTGDRWVLLQLLRRQAASAWEAAQAELGLFSGGPGTLDYLGGFGADGAAGGGGLTTAMMRSLRESTRSGSVAITRMRVAVALMQEVMRNADLLIEHLGNPFSIQYRRYTAELLYTKQLLRAVDYDQAFPLRSPTRAGAVPRLASTSLAQSVSVEGVSARSGDSDTTTTGSLLSAAGLDDEETMQHMLKQLGKYCSQDLLAGMDYLQRSVVLFMQALADDYRVGRTRATIDPDDEGLATQLLERSRKIVDSLERARELFIVNEGPSGIYALRAQANMAVYWYLVSNFIEWQESLWRIKRYVRPSVPPDIRCLANAVPMTFNAIRYCIDDHSLHELEALIGRPLPVDTAEVEEQSAIVLPAAKRAAAAAAAKQAAREPLFSSFQEPTASTTDASAPPSVTGSTAAPDERKYRRTEELEEDWRETSLPLRYIHTQYI